MDKNKNVYLGKAFINKLLNDVVIEKEDGTKEIIQKKGDVYLRGTINVPKGWEGELPLIYYKARDSEGTDKNGNKYLIKSFNVKLDVKAVEKSKSPSRKEQPKYVKSDDSGFDF